MYLVSNFIFKPGDASSDNYLHCSIKSWINLLFISSFYVIWFFLFDCLVYRSVFLYCLVARIIDALEEVSFLSWFIDALEEVSQLFYLILYFEGVYGGFKVSYSTRKVLLKATPSGCWGFG